jgi:hypothetical protein
MARLNAEVKIFIVTRLACFDTPQQVASAVKEVFGIELPRQAMEMYDPNKVAGKDLSQKLTKIFNETREQFINDTSDIPISHKAYRLRALQRMATKAEEKGNSVLAAQLHEQAAKEMGEAYTNRQKHEVTGKDGKPLMPPAKAYTNEELDKRIAELARKLGVAGGGG